MSAIRRVCVFCGSRPGTRAVFAEAARAAGAALAGAGWGLVFGGGSVGLMGIAADAALAAGAEVIGVIPSALANKEIAHERLTELRVVPGMHERKALMAQLCDAFVALPGGYGTFEELFEIITWSQLGISNKPVVLLNTDGFYDPLVRLVEHAVGEGFIRVEHRALFASVCEPQELPDALRNFVAPAPRKKWLEPGQA